MNLHSSPKVALVRLGLVAVFGTLACGVKMHPYPQAGGQGGAGAGPADSGSGNGAGGSGAGGNTNGGNGGNGGRGGNSGRGGASGPRGGGGTGSPGTGGSAATRTGGATGGGTDGAVTPPADMAPASGDGIMIGGKLVPKAKAIVFIHIGHSDMAGRADGPAELRGFMFDPHPQLWVYAKGGAFRAAREPTAGDAGSAGKSGPGMAILKTALTRAPDAYFISIGHGHSGASMGYCPNFRKDRLLWSTFMDAARELKGKVTFGGLFTMFGITEYHLGAAGLATTGDCILGLANDVRAELGVPDLPLMVGGWNEGGEDIYSPTEEYGRVVKPQLEMIPNRDPRSGHIPTNGLQMQDDRHLNMAGQKLWAERAFMIMEQKGFLPWAAR
jgi:hypothetical protein